MPYIPSEYDQRVQGRLTPTMPAMSSGAPEDFLTRARRMREQAVSAAPQSIDPRIAAILARREERLAEQEAEIAQQEASSPWDALIRAGAAMGASDSPFFGQALSAGVSEGLNSLNQGRAEAVRRRMALGGAREDIEMQRIEQEGAGKREALANLESDLKVGRDMADLSKAQAAAEADLARAREIDDPVMRRLKIGEAQRKLILLEEQANRQRTGQAADLALAGQRNRSGAAEAAPTVGKLSMAEVLQEDLDPYMEWMRTRSGEIKPVGGAKLALPAVDPAKLGELRLSIAKLKEIEADLVKGGYSGPTIGMIPEMALPVLAPKSKDMRDRVGTVTQEQLKTILGGQFARVEGEEFFKRGFDMSQSDPVNLKRVRSLRERLENIHNSSVARIERRLTPAMAAKLPPGTDFIGMDGKPYKTRAR